MSYILDFDEIKLLLQTLFKNHGIELFAWSLSLYIQNIGQEQIRTTWFLEMPKNNTALHKELDFDYKKLLEKVADYFIGKNFVINMFSINVYVSKSVFAEIEKIILKKEAHIHYFECVYKDIKCGLQFIEKT